MDPSSLAIGLFDDDELVDLAVANSGDDTVMVLLNSGDPVEIFFLADEIAVGANPVSIASGNMDGSKGDVADDLVVVNRGSATIDVLFNDGAGGFPDGVTLMGGDDPSSVDPLDVDNDKDLDLAVIDGDQVVIFENDNGGIMMSVVLPVGDDPVDVPQSDPLGEPGFDLDGNGFVDIVTANVGDGTVSVILNNGGLDFAPAVDLEVASGAMETLVGSLAALDMDGDDDIDLAAIIFDEMDGTRLVALRNDLNGGTQLAFAEPEDLGVEPGLLFVLAGDLDGDRDNDLVTVNGATSGAGPIQPGATVRRSLVNTGLVGDLDGDGAVGVDDLVTLLLAWGQDDPGDLDGDGVVGVGDLVILLENWTG